MDMLIGHRERSADAMILIRTALLVFGLFEIGQDIFIGPASAALLPPQIIIAGMAADIDHAVDRTGPAQHLAARLVQAPPFEANDA